MRLTDGIKLGVIPRQHHDPLTPLKRKNLTLAYRQLASEGPLYKPNPAIGSFGQDLASMNFWPQAAATRPFGAWSEAFSVVVSSAEGDPPPGVTATAAGRGGFGLLPDAGDGIANPTFEEKLGPDDIPWASRPPVGWTGLLNSGTEPDVQVDTWHPDFLALVADNRGEAGFGTKVVDITSANRVDPDRWAYLETLVSVENVKSASVAALVPGNYLALQLGEIGRGPNGPESGLLLSMQRGDRRTLLALSARMGGPFVESGGPVWGANPLGLTDEGVPIRPAALSAWTLFSDPFSGQQPTVQTRCGRLPFVDELGRSFDGTYGLPFPPPGIATDENGVVVSDNFTPGLNLTEGFIIWDRPQQRWKIVFPSPITPSVVPSPPVGNTTVTRPPRPGTVTHPGVPIGPGNPAAGGGPAGGGPRNQNVRPVQQVQQARPGANGGGGVPDGSPRHTDHGKKNNGGDLFAKYRARQKRYREAAQQRLEERAAKGNKFAKRRLERQERLRKKAKERRERREERKRRNKERRRKNREFDSLKDKANNPADPLAKTLERIRGNAKKKQDVRLGSTFPRAPVTFPQSLKDSPEWDVGLGTNFTQIGFKAQPFRDGEVPMGMGGGGMFDITKVASIGAVGADLTGGGVSRDNDQDGSAPTGSGSVVLLPGGTSIIEYVRGLAGVGAAVDDATTAVSLVSPTGQAQIAISQLDPATGQPKSGVVMKGTEAGGGEFVLVDGSGAEPEGGPKISIGEAGVDITGDASVSGKLTVDGRLDPTTLEFTPQATTAVPGAAYGLDVLTADNELYYHKAGTAIRLTQNGQAVGQVPNADNWGVSDNGLMTGNVTLTDSSNTVQWFIPDADRTVTLPTPTGASPFFYIYNAASTGFDVTINDHNGSAKVTLTDLQVGVCTTDGSDSWIVFVANTSDVDRTYQLYQYGGDRFAAGDFIHCWCPATQILGSGTTGATALQDASVVSESGTITGISWNTEIVTGTATVKVWKNGADTGVSVNLDLSAATKFTTVSPVSVSQGDIVALELDSGADPGDASLILVVENLISKGPQVVFGCTVENSAGNYMYGPGDGRFTNSDVGTLDYRTEMVIPVACDLSTFAIWHSTGDATSDWKILINGTVVSTHNNVATNYSANAISSTSAIVGDTLAIEWDGGSTIPQETRAVISFSGIQGAMFQFGGHAASTGDFYEPYTASSLGVSSSTANQQTEITVPIATSGTIYLGINTESTSATTDPDYGLWKNGAEASSFTGVGHGQGTDSLTGVSFAQGDELAIAYKSGDNPLDTNILLFLEAN